MLFQSLKKEFEGEINKNQKKAEFLYTCFYCLYGFAIGIYILSNIFLILSSSFDIPKYIPSVLAFVSFSLVAIEKMLLIRPKGDMHYQGRDIAQNFKRKLDTIASSGGSQKELMDLSNSWQKERSDWGSRMKMINEAISFSFHK